MFTALLRSQPDVRARLFKLVETSARPLLIAQEHDVSMGGPFERRQPYRYLLEKGADVSIVIVADDGHDGMWRDPIGELAAEYFDDPQDIAASVGGYLLFREGLDPTYLKRDLWDPLSDVRMLIARMRLKIEPPPEPPKEKEKPRFRRASDGRSEDEIDTDPGHSRGRPAEDTTKDEPRARRPRPTTGARPQAAPPPEPPPPPPEPPRPDPFAVLGIAKTANEEEVRKAFLGLVVQYHPDKVAHLAPEFRELAENKTRELTAAYEAAQRIVRGEPPVGS
ncbi:MAG: J domain-containing protein [Deltaproteobacteria bacterium]|nr:J domain-containing protein [Deltaproteobacteria bacterium]